MENILIDQFKKLDDETRGIISNELNQYKELQRLGEKLNESIKK